MFTERIKCELASLDPRASLLPGMFCSGCCLRAGGDKQGIQEASWSPGPNLDSLCSRIFVLSLLSELSLGTLRLNSGETDGKWRVSNVYLIVISLHPCSSHPALPPGLSRLLPTDSTLLPIIPVSPNWTALGLWPCGSHLLRMITVLQWSPGFMQVGPVVGWARFPLRLYFRHCCSLPVPSSPLALLVCSQSLQVSLTFLSLCQVGRSFPTPKNASNISLNTSSTNPVSVIIQAQSGSPSYYILHFLHHV